MLQVTSKEVFRIIVLDTPKTFGSKTLHSPTTKARDSHWWVSETKAPELFFLYQLMIAIFFAGDPGTSHKHGGKSLIGEQALEKSLIIALGWAQPVSFFSCPDRLLLLRYVAAGRAGQLVGRFKPGSPWVPRLLRPPLQRVPMPQSDEAHAYSSFGLA